MENNEWREKYHAGKTDNELMKTYIEGEVESYDNYLTGDVWAYQVRVDGVTEDQCGGFNGSEENAEREASSIAESYKKDWIVDCIINNSKVQLEEKNKDSRYEQMFEIASKNVGLDVKTLKEAVAAVKDAQAKVGGPSL